MNACFDLIASFGQTPTIIGTIAMARIVGGRFNDKDARALIRERLTHFHPLAPDLTQQNVRVYPPAPSSAIEMLGRARRGSQGMSKSCTNGTVSKSLLPSVGVAADAAMLPEWAERIQSRVRALGPREVRTLDHREVFDTAALWAIRFESRKHRTEEAVKKAALGLTGRIRNVVSSKDHHALHDLTVRELFAFGREAWEAADRQDLPSPWVVVAFAEAPERPPQPTPRRAT